MEMPTLSNGRYRIDRFIGQGGMAGVFLAFDNNLKVERAIKLLPPEFITNQKVRARFINEALAMAQIRHPNVVQIFDQVREGASLFLVMEYYRLGSLERILSERPLSISEALWSLKEISKGYNLFSIGPIPQSKFLNMFGINERLDNILTGLSSIKKKKKLEGEFFKLTSQTEMGELFKCMIFTNKQIKLSI